MALINMITMSDNMNDHVPGPTMCDVRCGACESPEIAEGCCSRTSSSSSRGSSQHSSRHFYTSRLAQSGPSRKSVDGSGQGAEGSSATCLVAASLSSSTVRSAPAHIQTQHHYHNATVSALSSLSGRPAMGPANRSLSNGSGGGASRQAGSAAAGSRADTSDGTDVTECTIGTEKCASDATLASSGTSASMSSSYCPDTAQSGESATAHGSAAAAVLGQSQGQGPGQGQAASSKPSRHLWLGNLLQRTGQADVETLFTLFGPVESVRVFPSKPSSYGFVNFPTVEAAAAAKASLEGRPVPNLTGAKPLLIRYQQPQHHNLRLWPMHQPTMMAPQTPDMLEYYDCNYEPYNPNVGAPRGHNHSPVYGQGHTPIYNSHPHLAGGPQDYASQAPVPAGLFPPGAPPAAMCSAGMMYGNPGNAYSFADAAGGTGGAGAAAVDPTAEQLLGLIEASGSFSAGGCSTGRPDDLYDSTDSEANLAALLCSLNALGLDLSYARDGAPCVPAVPAGPGVGAAAAAGLPQQVAHHGPPLGSPPLGFAGQAGAPVGGPILLRSGSSSGGGGREDGALAAAPALQDAPSRHLWLGNMLAIAEEQEIERAFAPFGSLESVRLFPERNYAFVNFLSPESAAAARAALHGKPLPCLTGVRAMEIRFQQRRPQLTHNSAHPDPSSASTAAAPTVAQAPQAPTLGSMQLPQPQLQHPHPQPQQQPRPDVPRPLQRRAPGSDGSGHASDGHATAVSGPQSRYPQIPPIGAQQAALRPPAAPAAAPGTSEGVTATASNAELIHLCQQLGLLAAAGPKQRLDTSSAALAGLFPGVAGAGAEYGWPMGRPGMGLGGQEGLPVAPGDLETGVPASAAAAAQLFQPMFKQPPARHPHQQHQRQQPLDLDAYNLSAAARQMPMGGPLANPHPHPQHPHPQHPHPQHPQHPHQQHPQQQRLPADVQPNLHASRPPTAEGLGAALLAAAAANLHYAQAAVASAQATQGVPPVDGVQERAWAQALAAMAPGRPTPQARYPWMGAAGAGLQGPAQQAQSTPADARNRALAVLLQMQALTANQPGLAAPNARAYGLGPEGGAEVMGGALCPIAPL